MCSLLLTGHVCSLIFQAQTRLTCLISDRNWAHPKVHEWHWHWWHRTTFMASSRRQSPKLTDFNPLNRKQHVNTTYIIRLWNSNDALQRFQKFLACAVNARMDGCCLWRAERHHLDRSMFLRSKRCDRAMVFGFFLIPANKSIEICLYLCFRSATKQKPFPARLLG